MEMFALCPLPAGVFAALDQISQVFGLRYRPGNSSGLAQKRPTRMHIPALPANTLLYRSCWARRGDSFRNNHPAILGIIELKLMIDSIKYSTVVGNIYKKSFNSVGRPRKEPEGEPKPKRPVGRPRKEPEGEPALSRSGDGPQKEPTDAGA